MTISVFCGVYPLLLEKPNAFFSKQYLDDIGPFSYAMLCLMMLVSCNSTVHILYSMDTTKFSQVHQKINLTSWCTVYVNINCSMISLK